MKKILIITLTLFFTLNGFSQIDSVKTEIQKKAGNDWIVEINDSLVFAHPYLTKGKYIARVILINKKDTVEFLLFSSSNADFENEIINYHKLANCFLTKENYKSRLFLNKNYFVFLPSYPCWEGGYSVNSKDLIKRIFDK